MMPGVGWAFNGGDCEPHVAWIREYWTHVEPYVYGSYTNDAAADVTTADTAANLALNLEWLTAVKNRYDPTNLFRLNANIRPTV
jgi:hypothetical protein